MEKARSFHKFRRRGKQLQSSPTTKVASPPRPLAPSSPSQTQAQLTTPKEKKSSGPRSKVIALRASIRLRRAKLGSSESCTTFSDTFGAGMAKLHGWALKRRMHKCGLVGVIAPIDDMTRIHAWVPESWARANMDRFVGGEYLKESPHPGMRRRKGGGEGTPAEPDDGRDPPWMSRGFGAEEDWGSQRRLYCESDPEKSQRKVESESDVETGGGGGGGGKRDIILLLQAFGPSAAFHWGAQVAVLYKRFDIIMPDLVFLGESTSRSEERSEVFQAVCVDGLLRFFGITSCHVVSMGYGGFVAFRLAQLFPEKIQKLIITSCPGPVLTRKDYEESLHDLEVENWIDIFLPSTAAALQKNMMAIMYKPPPIATWMLIGAMKEALKGSTQEKRELLQHLHAYLDSPEPEMPRLPSVKDILLIWGRYDRLFPLHLGERFQRHLGGRAKLKIVDQSGHSPSVESPREYNELIVKFLLGKEERWQPHHEAWKGWDSVADSRGCGLSQIIGEREKRHHCLR